MTEVVRPKALCLLSGGLDSTLAARIILDLGLELEAVNFVSSFCTCTPKTSTCAAAASAARQLGIDVRVLNTTREMISIVRDPPHGFGTNLNPCIDCRINAFRRALEYMHECGAQFLVTGEVLGERPMSQRRDAMQLIERESGAEGLVLRPLCAGLLEPSVPEREGWVDRSRLLSISGRSRKPQIALAREHGIDDYPCPAGGCRLTDPGFAGRMLDLLDHQANVSVGDVNLLRLGRHFRLSMSAKVVVGRDENENGLLGRAARAEDIVLAPRSVPGPTALVLGVPAAPAIREAAAIVAHYVGARGAAVAIVIRDGAASECVTAEPAPRSQLEAAMVKPLERGWRRRRMSTGAGGAGRRARC